MSSPLGGVLREREGVAFGISEPRYSCAAGCCPDGVIVLLEEAEALEDDPFGGEVANGGDYFLHAPTEEGEGEGRERLDASDPDVSAAGCDFEREVIFAKESEAQKIDVEGAGAGEVAGGDEAHDGSVCEHRGTSGVCCVRRQFSAFGCGLARRCAAESSAESGQRG